MGMFRSSENEFLLCYDGKGALICSPHLSSHPFSQNSGCMLTATATLVAQKGPLSGKALPSTSHGILHTSSSSTRGSLRCDMLKLGGCARSSLVTTSDVSGMDEER